MADLTIKKIAVAGSGKMGSDIFNLLLEYRFQLVLLCQNAKERDRSLMNFNRQLVRLSRYGAIDDAERARRESAVVITEGLAGLANCDLIIEAISEEIETKKNFFACLDEAVNGDCIFATNSSSIIPSRLFTGNRRDGRFFGVHFFFPVRLKHIVEYIIPAGADEAIERRVRQFLDEIGRVVLELPESSAFILNRTVLDLQAQASLIAAEGGVGFREIDRIVRGRLFPIGVFEFMDHVGIDIMLGAVLEYTVGTADADFYAPLIGMLGRLAAQGRNGVKSGAGFYDYPSRLGGDAHVSQLDDQTVSGVIDLLNAVYINSAYKVLEKKVCTGKMLDMALKEYLDTDIGPVAMSLETGTQPVRSILERLHAATGYEAYRPSSLLV